MQTEKVTIIGAGPAGIAAAIQLRRWGITPLVLEKDHIGGLLVNANLVENYPGFPQGISGPELVDLFRAQMERIGIDVIFEEVLQVDYEDQFHIMTSRKEFVSEYVIIASGTSPKPFNDIRVAGNMADAVFTEIHPLLNHTNKKMAIIGAGDAAFDYAINLASRNNDVVILNKTGKLKCLPLLWERWRKLSQITYMENTAVESINMLDKEVILKCQNRQGDWELKVDYVILAIGRIPQRGFLSATLEGMSSELENKGIIHFVGDVKNGIFRQTSIAVGDGIRAAMRICQLREETR